MAVWLFSLSIYYWKGRTTCCLSNSNIEESKEIKLQGMLVKHIIGGEDAAIFSGLGEGTET